MEIDAGGVGGGGTGRDAVKTGTTRRRVVGKQVGLSQRKKILNLIQAVVYRVDQDPPLKGAIKNGKFKKPMWVT